MKVHELITYLSTLPADTEIHTVKFYCPEYWGTTPLSLYNLKIDPDDGSLLIDSEEY